MWFALRRALRWAGLIVALLAVVWVYAPALASYFVLDDFGLLAYSRLLGDPLPIFAHDHFPGSLFFRPLTMAFWWATVALFGSAPAPQYACNLLLHLAVAATLGWVALELTRERLAAGLAALLFALHPIGIGTALWLSDRFDLLAALFSLLAIVAALHYRRDQRALQLFATLALALAAFLSKETGLVVVAPIAVLWSWPRDRDRGLWTRPRMALIGLAVLALAWLAWRGWLMQGPGGTLLLEDAPLVEIVWQGFVRWLVGYGRLLGFWPRLSPVDRLFVCAGAVVWLALAGGAVRECWRRRGDRRSLPLVLAALALILVPGLVQAPVTRVSAIVLGPVDSAWPAAFAARFYYLSLCGLGLLLAAVAMLGWQSHRRFIARLVAVAATIAILLPLGLVAHRLAEQFRTGSQPAKAVAEAAVAAIARAPLPRTGCQVYLLDVDDSVAWFFVPFADSIVKAVTPDLAGVRDCLIQGEGTPWFQMVGRDALAPADVAPMVPLYDHGRRVPWMEIGDLEAVYLNLFPGIDAQHMRNAIFLAWHDGRFVDVGAAVRAGRRTVVFKCLRPGRQCDCPGQACPGGLTQDALKQGALKQDDSAVILARPRSND
ncbi:MAG TPA: hypothetical protein VFG55_03285 [Rhodanobacteraceae bacterium]|nr:hypothetical protein [Rhodanobacteraceae bacterium]